MKHMLGSIAGIIQLCVGLEFKVFKGGFYIVHIPFKVKMQSSGLFGQGKREWNRKIQVLLHILYIWSSFFTVIMMVD